MVEHTCDPVGSDQRAQVGLLRDLGFLLVGLDEGLDVGEAAGLGEAADGEVLSIARGDGGGVVLGDGGVDL